MSNPNIIWRANSNSSLYQTIKARNSKQNVFDYAVSGEKNICPVARSKIVVSPTTSMNATAQQTLKFELPNHGLLEDMYLVTKFVSGTAGQNLADGSKDIILSQYAGAFAWTKVRVVFQGTTIWECTPEWVLASEYTRGSKERCGQLDVMLGAGVVGTPHDTIGSRTGRRSTASAAGGTSLACPLNGFWKDSLGRNFDLYSLHSRVHVEVDYRANGLAHELIDDTSMAQTYADAQLFCYINELAPEELVSYQARNYSPGSVSSQLGFTTTHFSESITSPVLITGSSTTGNKIKLNSISGLVRRLYIWTTLDSDITAKKYMLPTRLARARLLAGNSVIAEVSEACVFDEENASTSNGYKVDNVIEQYHNNLPTGYGSLTFGSTGDVTTLNVAQQTGAGGSSALAFDPSRIVVFNFAMNPDDYSSADGCVSFGQLSNPQLEIMFNTAASTNNHTVHVVAEQVVINTYNTSQTGSIGFKSISE